MLSFGLFDFMSGFGCRFVNVNLLVFVDFICLVEMIHFMYGNFYVFVCF